MRLLSFLVFLPLAVQAAHYRGTCTPKAEFCAYFSPRDMPIEVVRRTLLGAKKNIKIATYNMDDEDLAPILWKKAREGIKIQFLVDYKLSFSSNSVWNKMIKHKNVEIMRIPVVRGANPQMHNKIIIIDDLDLSNGPLGRAHMLFGSANFTYSGLVGNFENVLMINAMASSSAKQAIQKFREEFDELRDSALSLCAYFALPNGKEASQDRISRCAHGNATFPAHIHHLLTTGKLDSSVVTSEPRCQELTRDDYYPGGLIDAYGQLKTIYAKDPKDRFSVEECLNSKYKKQYVGFAKKIFESIHFANGQAVKDVVSKKEWWKDLKDTQAGRKVRVYFSPEDNVENVIITELKRTLNAKDPNKAFAYLSTNFITNKEILKTLKLLKDKGVHLSIFYDRGRFDDPNFLRPDIKELLEPLKENITIFNNELSGPYGCNHNKFAIVGDGNKLRLINGSANWSAGAMKYNDENLTVIEDEKVVAIYLREIMSQLFAYRYMQDPDHVGFKQRLSFLMAQSPCFQFLMTGKPSNCPGAGSTWKPKITSSSIMSIIPPDEVKKHPHDWNVWIIYRYPKTDKWFWVRAYSHEVFAGRWVGSIAIPIGQELEFKFAAEKKDSINQPIVWLKPNKPMSELWWEKRDNRTQWVAPLAVDVVKGPYQFGK